MMLRLNLCSAAMAVTEEEPEARTVDAVVTAPLETLDGGAGEGAADPVVVAAVYVAERPEPVSRFRR